MSIEERAAEIARQYITRTVDAPVSGELMIVCSDNGPRLLRRGIEVRSADELGRALEPVLREAGLQRTDRRTLDPDLQIAPVLVVLRVAGPVIGDPGAAGEADAAVDDERLAMRAVVDAPQVVPANRVVPRDVTAALVQDAQDLVAHRRRAHCVEQNLDTHAPPGSSRERARKLIPISPAQ